MFLPVSIIVKIMNQNRSNILEKTLRTFSSKTPGQFVARALVKWSKIRVFFV